MTEQINLKRRTMLCAAGAFATPKGFRDEDFIVTAFGAKPCELAPVRGARDCHPAIAAAIAACNKAGGGRVVIPKGNWYIGMAGLLAGVTARKTLSTP
jgi:polygalacturonase